MRIILLISVLVVGFAAHADTLTTLVANCRSAGVDYSVYAARIPHDGDELTVVTSEISTVTKLNRSTTGVYHQGAVELPTYWRPTRLKAEECQAKTNQTRVKHDVPMSLEAYFLEGDPRPDVDLDQMIRDHDAIPVKVDIICTTGDAAAATPLGCSRIRILNSIIPVNPVRLQRGLQTSSLMTVESSNCSSGVPTRASGVVINWQGRPLLVTSSSAIVRDSQRTCTEAIGADGKRWPLTLVKLEAAYGLAALSFANAPSVGLSLSEQKASDYPDRANLFGTSKSSATVSSTSVEILASASTRHFLPMVSQAVEILGGSFDSGWRGAALIDPLTSSVLGIASHEYLQIFPGSLTRPLSWHPDQNETSDHLVVISASTISHWLAKLQEPPLPLIETVDGVFQSGHLKFSQDCPPLDSSQSAGEYPIGGADPVGIGGDGSNYRACKIKVSLAPGDAHFLRPDLQPWHDNLEQQLGAGYDIQLYSQVSREGSRLERRYFYSVESFFQELSTLGKSDAILEIASKSGVNGVDPKLSPLRTQAAEVAKRARSIYLSSSFGDPTIGNLERHIYLVATLLESEQQGLITADDFQTLLANEHAWSFLNLVAGGAGLHTQLKSLQQIWTQSK